MFARSTSLSQTGLKVLKMLPWMILRLAKNAWLALKKFILSNRDKIASKPRETQKNEYEFEPAALSTWRCSPLSPVWSWCSSDAPPWREVDTPAAATTLTMPVSVKKDYFFWEGAAGWLLVGDEPKHPLRRRSRPSYKVEMIDSQ